MTPGDEHQISLLIKDARKSLADAKKHKRAGLYHTALRELSWAIDSLVAARRRLSGG